MWFTLGILINFWLGFVILIVLWILSTQRYANINYLKLLNRLRLDYDAMQRTRNSSAFNIIDSVIGSCPKEWLSSNLQSTMIYNAIFSVPTLLVVSNTLILSLRKICENTGIFNFVYSRIFSEYSRIRTKCGPKAAISPNAAIYGKYAGIYEI